MAAMIVLKLIQIKKQIFHVVFTSLFEDENARTVRIVKSGE